MAIGRRRKRRQQSLWIELSSIQGSPGHPFYERLNHLLDRHGFNEFVDREYARFYAEKMGLPSAANGVLLDANDRIFRGVDSRRGTAWCVADTLSLRAFLGYGLTDSPPDQATVSRTRRLIDQDAHESVFTKVLQILAKEVLLKGKTLLIDATTRAELARLDKKRKKKTSNDDWHNPHDPDAKITKMKNCPTHLVHEAKHTVDLETGAVVAVTVQPADRGDTSSMENTLAEDYSGFRDRARRSRDGRRDPRQLPCEVVADKGYPSLVRRRHEDGFRTYISEPDRGRRNWNGKAREKQAVYGNRRRTRGDRGKRLLCLRAERVKHPMAHAYETGGMRRTHLRGHPNIQKRLLIQFAGLNLGLVMRHLFRKGIPRGLQGLRTAFFSLFQLLHRILIASEAALGWSFEVFRSRTPPGRKLGPSSYPNRVAGRELLRQGMIDEAQKI